MDAEVLIVGRPAATGELLGPVCELGYLVDLCDPDEIAARLGSGSLPRAIVVCLADVDAPLFMAEVRRVQRGAAIPITLYGQLGGAVLDLADVLDLGADHFLEQPVQHDALAAALEALAGPPLQRASARPAKPAVVLDEPSSWPSRTEVIETDAPVARVRPPSDGRDVDPMIGQLHRTLDLVPETRDGSQSEDDLDLASLGIAIGPGDLLGGDGIDPAESHDRLEVAELRLVVPPGIPRVDVPHVPPGPRETTVLLEDSSPLVVRSGVQRFTPPDGATGEVREHTAPGVLVTAEIADRPRRRVPLPLEREGDLGTVEVPRLLCRLHRAGYTGKLTLALGRTEKSLWLDGGALVFARSNSGSDRLIDGLLRRGMLTRSQYDAARRATDADPRRAGQVLVEAGYLKPSELVGALQDHLARIVDSTLAWREGRWLLEPDVRCEEPITLATPTAVLLVEGIRQRLEPAHLWGLVGGPRVFPRLREEAAGRPSARAELAEGLRLSPAEESWLERFDGGRDLAALCELPDADQIELLPLVYALHVLDLLELPGEPLPVARSVEGPGEIDRRRIEDRLALARDADYFALLSLDRGATRADVRVAHADLLRTFADDRIDTGVRSDLAGELVELRAALDEAKDVLQDDALRNAYLAQLEEP